MNFDLKVPKNFFNFNIQVYLFSLIPLVTKVFKYFTDHLLKILNYMTQLT